MIILFTIFSSSEPVVENTVKLKCLQQPSSGIKVSVGSVTVKKGFSSQIISVQIKSFGNGESTALSCVAQSIGGSQYNFSNSQGQSTLLIPTDGKLSLYVNEIIDDLSMLCYVDTATSEANANSLLNNTECTTSEQNNVTINSWVIYPTNVDFKLSQSSSLQRNLYLTRVSFPNASEAGSVEIVIVRCCNPAVYDPAFFGVRATARIDVLLPNAPTAISENSPLDDSQTVLPNPIFSPVPPCPCDVTQAVCDLGCCCDPFCPEDQPVPCLTGAFGGDSIVMDPRFCGSVFNGSLSSINYPKEYLSTASNTPMLLTQFPGFHQLRCVVADNGAVLGYVYPQTYIARNEKQLVSNYESSQQFYLPLALTDSGVRQFSEPSSPTGDGYREGDALRLVRQVVSLSTGGAPIVVDGPENFPLMLPDPISCDLPSGSTVDYLVERKTYQCPITMDEISCQAAIATEATLTLGMGPQSIASRLSSRAYLIADDVLARLSQSGYQLRARGIHSAGRAPTVVNYYCLTAKETSIFTIQSDVS
ncbi:hypothetical protein P879_01424 [Paragonimus westermani]|uniref:Tectonic-1-3 N-terminal domain-containing protein n=1 Tax=Paragonimus westermani TaxID=34504 RepID=A0A8T0DWF2_9TREM|nr:hypothetical protein P879_01424 [Paragonimus westermani]